MSKKVEIDFVLKLQGIFTKKNWMGVPNYNHAFESLCNLSSHFEDDEDQKLLFFELIEKYDWMSLNDYIYNINNLLEKIFANFSTPIKRFYTFPIIKPEDEGKNKSGNTISYMIKCNKPFLDFFKNSELIEFTNFNEFDSLALKDDDYIILVDDFIGSGETLNACTTRILEINPQLESKILIATIVIHYDTVKNVKFPLFHNLEVRKGISDFYASPNKEKNIDLMVKLENKLISGRNFSLGYEQSEGLITLMRTPDNTFPIFWHQYKKSIGFNPPFPRE